LQNSVFQKETLTEDDIWTRHYYPETKRLNFGSSGDQRPKQMSRSKVKTILDIKVIIHYKSVSPNNQLRILPSDFEISAKRLSKKTIFGPTNGSRIFKMRLSIQHFRQKDYPCA
jgi:hypothetical protein